MGKTIVISNQKGGCGKSMTAVNLGIGLARQGKRVLLLDADSQHSLSVSLGITEPDKIPITLASVMANVIENKAFNPTEGIIHHAEGVDLLPANSALVNTELRLVSEYCRELILRRYTETVKPLYDWCIIDTSPSLGLLTVNALAAADSVLIPVSPKYLDAKGLELLLRTISQVRKQINPNLSISGILLTMVDKRMNFTREIISLIEKAYGGNIHIFSEHIPRSVRAAETSAAGKSIFAHDPHGKVAAAYEALTGEVLDIA